MTVYQYTPSDVAPFQFQPTLDGATYNVTVTWNVFGQREYINVSTLAGTPVYCCPLIGSVAEYPVSLLPPLNPTTGRPWASRLYYVASQRTFVVTP